MEVTMIGILAALKFTAIIGFALNQIRLMRQTD